MGFRLINVAGRAALVAGDDYFDLETISDGEFGSCPIQAIARHRELPGVSLTGGAATGTLETAALGPPVPTPSKIFGIGLNYRAHAEESNMEIPTVPLVFAKFPSCISGPHDDVVLRGEFCDYEGEMVVVIGDECKDVGEEDAWQVVAGMTCGNDFSDRQVQMASRPPQFNLGKSFDTFGPIGPAVVSKDLVENRDGLPLRLTVNGEQRQNSNTSDLIFAVPQLVSYLSRITRLFPGDLIFTGTPSGVGMAQKTFLRDGDVVVTEVEGLGAMRNRCVMG
jgi:2-keto-4-pentenoate hydratase/2-oxohepta-3-ene-1,7-dioic acid hydratase in catechol pathway